MSRWKNLETRLHAIAEAFTQGHYGRRDQKVDLEQLGSDVGEALMYFECGEDEDDDDDT